MATEATDWMIQDTDDDGDGDNAEDDLPTWFGKRDPNTGRWTHLAVVDKVGRILTAERRAGTWCVDVFHELDVSMLGGSDDDSVGTSVESRERHARLVSLEKLHRLRFAPDAEAQTPWITWLQTGQLVPGEIVAMYTPECIQICYPNIVYTGETFNRDVDKALTVMTVLRDVGFTDVEQMWPTVPLWDISDPATPPHVVWYTAA